MEYGYAMETGLALAEEQRRRAEGIVGGLDLIEILNCDNFVDLMELPDVPRSTLLVKGILERRDKLIPLMDVRVNLNAADPSATDAACALIVGVRNAEIGLIMPLGAEA